MAVTATPTIDGNELSLELAGAEGIPHGNVRVRIAGRLSAGYRGVVVKNSAFAKQRYTLPPLSLVRVDFQAIELDGTVNEDRWYVDTRNGTVGTDPAPAPPAGYDPAIGAWHIAPPGAPGQGELVFVYPDLNMSTTTATGADVTGDLDAVTADKALYLLAENGAKNTVTLASNNSGGSFTCDSQTPSGAFNSGDLVWVYPSTGPVAASASALTAPDVAATKPVLLAWLEAVGVTGVGGLSKPELWDLINDLLDDD